MIFKLKDRPDPTTLPHHMDVALIERVLEGILIAAAAWVHCAKASLKYARAIAVLSKSARDSESYNVNLSIRAHVLASAEGIRWAIGILGAGRIARWKTEFHRRRKGVVIIRRHIRLPSGIIKLPTKPRAYKWKLIALPKMAGLCFPVYYLGFKSFPDLHPHFSQPRPRRVMPPAVFWPHELVLNSAPLRGAAVHAGRPAGTERRYADSLQAEPSVKSGMSGVEGGIDDVPLGCAKRPFTGRGALARSDDLRQTNREQKCQDNGAFDNLAPPQIIGLTPLARSNAMEQSCSQIYPHSSLRASARFWRSQISPARERSISTANRKTKKRDPPASL